METTPALRPSTLIRTHSSMSGIPQYTPWIPLHTSFLGKLPEGAGLGIFIDPAQAPPQTIHTQTLRSSPPTRFTNPLILLGREKDQLPRWICAEHKKRSSMSDLMLLMVVIVLGAMACVLIASRPGSMSAPLRLNFINVANIFD